MWRPITDLKAGTESRVVLRPEALDASIVAAPVILHRRGGVVLSRSGVDYLPGSSATRERI
jgi:hypothetical protein